MKYANVPIFFDKEMLKWLRGSFTLGKINERNESLTAEYQAICQAVPEFQKYTYEEFVWGRLVVITRIFGLVINGLKTDGLVPYADMLNHKRPRQTKWTYEDSHNGFIITTIRSVQRGDQVFDSYGRKCNSRFFVNYGFSLEENEDNEAVMFMGLKSNDPFYSIKANILLNNPHQREFQVPANYTEQKTKEMFSFLRFCNARDNELMQITTSQGIKIEEINPISIINEVHCLSHIRDAALTALSMFQTTVDQDNKLLASGQITDSNIRNCVVVRRGEKEVLHWYVNLADNAIPLLRMPWRRLKNLATKSMRNMTPFDEYVMAVVVPLVKKYG